MSDDTLSGDGLDDLLAFQALLYASGELEGPARSDFEQRLANDQAARDALCQAVQMTTALAGPALQAPDRRYRDGVRRRLARPRSWALRGHPILWAGFGAAAAVLIMLGTRRPEPPAPSAPTPAPVVAEVPVEPLPPDEVEDPWAEADPTLEIATHWAELHNSRHLKRAVGDETRRKQRSEERQPVVNLEGRRTPPLSNPSQKN